MYLFKRDKNEHARWMIKQIIDHVRVLENEKCNHYRYHYHARRYPADMTPWLRPQKDFSWEVLRDLFFENEGIPLLKESNAYKQMLFYTDLLKQAEKIAAQINSPNPDHATIYQLIQTFRTSKTVVPSILNQDSSIEIGVSYFFGHNIISHLFLGIVNAIASLAAIIVSLLFTTVAASNHSPYFGTNAFLLDAMALFLESLERIFSAIIFPISLVYAQYSTGSCNIFKGDLARMLDKLEQYYSIEAMNAADREDDICCGLL